MKGDFIVIEIGCLECGIGSYLVGRFETEEAANEFKRARRNTSDVAYEIFNLNNITEPSQ